MNEQQKYTKLSNLIDSEFTIKNCGPYVFKKWDTESGSMLVSEKFEPGYRKLYTIDTDKGRLDLGSGQLSTLLEATYKQGKADINNQTFHVKSNGKSGMEIRYYFNLVRKQEPEPLVDPNEEQINPEDIPF